jgi:hypothetical protein
VRRSGAKRQPSPAVRRALRLGPTDWGSHVVLGPVNYLLMALGLVAIVLGFILLAMEDISVSPVLLVLGYCILIPAGLLLRGLPWKRTPSETGEGSGGE